MKSIGESLTEAEIDEMLHFADSDGSGTIDCELHRGLICDWLLTRITVNEFVQIMNQK